MTINLTLLIQAFHFYIAYLIISKIFLKPAISVVKNEEKTEKDLLSFIKSKKFEIEEKESLKKSLWEKYKTKFDYQKPKEIEKHHIKWTIPESKEISQNTVSKIKEDITNLIIKKVDHVQ